MGCTAYEDPIREAVKKQGLQCTCAGAGVACSNLIYVLVLWLIVASLEPAEAEVEMGFDYIYQITGAFVLLSIGFLVLGERLKGFFLRMGELIPAPMPLLRELEASGDEGRHVTDLTAQFYIGSMLATIPACAPGVLALTLALLQIFSGGSLTADIPAFVVMVVLGACSTVQILRVMPTAGRLELFLRGELLD
ncbi:MAG: hypothetical protein ACYTGH_07935 [Planctomycetota bacterium]|jgi:hypothetical protein